MPIKLLKIRKIATETHDLDFITNEQLGFEVDRVESKESYPVDFRYPDDWAKFNQDWIPDEPNVLRWKNTEKDSAKAFYMRMMKTLSILEHAAVIHGTGPDIATKARNMIEFLRAAQGLLSDLDLDWKTQLTNLSRPETKNSPEIEVSDSAATPTPSSDID